MLTDWLNWILGAAALAWAVFGLWAAAHALMYKRDPRSALGWAMVCLLMPYVGPLIYLAFGINRINRHAQRLGHLPAFQPVSSETRQLKSAERACPPEAFEFFNISNQVALRPIVPGNRVQTYFSGDDAYAEMQNDIKRARRSVMLATYIFQTDKSGRQFIEALQDAVERGVDVWVLIDGVGVLYSAPWATYKLSQAGVTNAKFIPLTLLPPSLHLNLRNHRKLLVIDGAVGYTGGMNIGDHHVANKNGTVPVVDMHFRLTGPIVGQLEEVFVEDWHFSTRELIPRSSPEDTQARDNELENDAWARAISDGPDDDLGKIELIIMSAVSAAQESVRIMSPYFLPQRNLIAALKSAALRGVTVDVVLPAKSNLRYVDWATRNMLWELLKWGVRVWCQPPPFAHTKLFIVDEKYLHIGSANMDPRSLRLNFEIAVEVYDDELGAKLVRHVDEIIAKSRSVTLEEVDGRSLPVRLRDSVAWLFSPYL